MSFKFLLILSLIAGQVLACPVALKPGGRSGLHGMVIFGKGSYFIEHIPMLHPPHDFQIVASIVIRDTSGNILSPDLSGDGFTLKPSGHFSLNDLVNGQIKTFSGEIYQGSFEQSGKVMPGFEKINIEITKLELVRQLPDEAKQAFFQVADSSSNIYRTNIITPKSNRQLIENKTLSKELWCVVGPDFFEPCN